MKTILRALCLVIVAGCQLVFAGDIAKDIRTGNVSGKENGGYFGIGLFASYLDGGRIYPEKENEGDSFGINIGGDYYYNGFFIEASQGTFDGLNLGYNFLNKENWSFDVLFSSFQGRLEIEEDKRFKSTIEDERNAAILERNTFYNGAGLRATAHFDSYIFQYRLVTDTHEGNGISSTARIGRSWQVKNWNLHSILSMEYSSSDKNNFLYGVTAEEATGRFPQYDLGSSIIFSGEVGVTYPLTEHSVFKSFLRYTDLPKNIENSPLMEDDNETLLVTSISYIF
ncbi:MipA/OmpV family protein [Marinomonas sp. 15G1-11]|uniref:MipA/OmpV family protein n=1 Tax=Marinomonas phaeophyticola TaxID=3004091 RepID=A0ABT4JYJ9_9GAMM|nr:MipA/OmpV family protein [Marinomonas sp. 15G1-11]MCZ2723462.1 MipA/OmpV family protein [Marinomonas sp. 15G1-11]